MSIASEITRLQGVKSDILQAISDKGVTVPAGSALDDCPGLIASISGNTDISKFSFAHNSADIVNGKTVITTGGIRHFTAGTNYFNFPSRPKIQVDFIIDAIGSIQSYLIMAGFSSASGLSIYFDNQKISIWETSGTDPDQEYNINLIVGKNYRVVLECINPKKYKFVVIDKDTQNTLIDSICDFTIDITWTGYLTFGGMRYGNSSAGFELKGSIDLKNTKVVDVDTNEMVWGLT